MRFALYPKRNIIYIYGEDYRRRRTHALHFCNRQCADTRRQPLVGKDWRRVGGYRGRQGRDEEHPNLWNMQMRMAQSTMRSQSYCLAARVRPEQCEWRKETHDAIFLPMCQGWPHLFLRCCRQLLCGERVKRARCWKGNVSVKLRQDIARVLSHKGVMVEGRPALLRQSYMDCPYEMSPLWVSLPT